MRSLIVISLLILGYSYFSKKWKVESIAGGQAWRVSYGNYSIVVVKNGRVQGTFGLSVIGTAMPTPGVMFIGFNPATGLKKVLVFDYNEGRIKGELADVAAVSNFIKNL